MYLFDLFSMQLLMSSRNLFADRLSGVKEILHPSHKTDEDLSFGFFTKSTYLSLYQSILLNCD